MKNINSAIVFVLLLNSFVSCQIEQIQFNDNKQTPESETSLLLDSITDKENFDLDLHLQNYERLKARIIKDKISLRTSTEEAQERKIELAQDYISTMLIDSIFPYWVDTKWDFNGHTDSPRVGEVACGYFVSTSIRHIDVKINRFKVAQMASSDIIKELCDPESIKKFNSMEKLENHLKTLEDKKLLIIGLDYHVGFIYNIGGVSYFAHSNYENLKGVEIVPVEDCFALESSNNYVIGSFSGNKELAKNWLNK